MSKAKVDIEDSLAYFVYRGARLLRVQLLNLLERSGCDVTPEQWFLLNKLRLAGGQTQTELGEEIFSDRPNVSRMVAALEKKGLLVRTTDSADERAKRLNLTARGVRVTDEIGEMVRVERRSTFRGISQSELDQAISTLRKLELNVLALLT